MEILRLSNCLFFFLSAVAEDATSESLGKPRKAQEGAHDKRFRLIAPCTGRAEPIKADPRSIVEER
jgi:hypothetical protein